MYSKIVVGTDGSATAKEAVDHAGRLASLCGASVHLVHGRGGPVVVGDAMMVVPMAINEEAAASLEAAIEAQAEELRAQGVEASTHVVALSGPEAVLTHADEQGADLIVVGNRGMTGKRRFILGSVPNAVSHHAPCSVLIVHTA